jgi:hypothetical protein
MFRKTSKYAYEMVVPKIAKNLKEKRDIADKQLKSRDEILSVLSPEGKINVKTSNPLSKFKEKIRKIVDKKAKGGRVGYRKGTPNPFARKSNVEKIAEVFGPKKKIKKEKEKQNVRMQAKKGGDAKKKKKFPDLTGDGKVTFADILKGRGVINGKKKTKKKII